MTDEEAFAAAVQALPPQIVLTLSRETAVRLVSVIQLASRHPSARSSPVIRDAVHMAREMQAAMAAVSPEIDRLLERGWHEVYDVRREGTP